MHKGWGTSLSYICNIWPQLAQLLVQPFHLREQTKVKPSDNKIVSYVKRKGLMIKRELLREPTCSKTGKDIHSGKLSPQIFFKSSLLRDPRSFISTACKANDNYKIFTRRKKQKKHNIFNINVYITQLHKHRQKQLNYTCACIISNENIKNIIISTSRTKTILINNLRWLHLALEPQIP